MFSLQKTQKITVFDNFDLQNRSFFAFFSFFVYIIIYIYSFYNERIDYHECHEHQKSYPKDRKIRESPFMVAQIADKIQQHTTFAPDKKTNVKKQGRNYTKRRRTNSLLQGAVSPTFLYQHKYNKINRVQYQLAKGQHTHKTDKLNKEGFARISLHLGIRQKHVASAAMTRYDF